VPTSILFPWLSYLAFMFGDWYTWLVQLVWGTTEPPAPPQGTTVWRDLWARSARVSAGQDKELKTVAWAKAGDVLCRTSPPRFPCPNTQLGPMRAYVNRGARFGSSLSEIFAMWQAGSSFPAKPTGGLWPLGNVPGLLLNANLRFPMHTKQRASQLGRSTQTPTQTPKLEMGRKLSACHVHFGVAYVPWKNSTSTISSSYFVKCQQSTTRAGNGHRCRPTRIMHVVAAKSFSSYRILSQLGHREH
jgi:hypothetical protein